MTSRPLKHVADVRFSSVDKKSVDGQVPVRLCNYTDVYYNDRITPDMPFMQATATPEQVARFSLKRGDVLLTKDSETADDIGVSAVVSEDMSGVLCGYHLAMARPRHGTDGRFLRWALAASASRGQLEVAATGVTRFGLRQDAVAGIDIPVPSLAGQRVIADYLDAESSRVDSVLDALRRALALGDERRAVLLGEVMTGRHTVSASALLTAPSRKLSTYAEVDLGRARSPENADGPDMTPYLRAANVKDGRLALDTILEMNFSVREQQRYSLHPGDILVTEGAGSLAAVGVTAVWGGELPGVVCFQNHLLRVRARPATDPQFLAWWMRFAYESGLLGSVASGAQILNLGTEEVRGLMVRFPTRAEQGRIAQFLGEQIDRLDLLRDSVQRQIDLLLERRQALITAAVTGQLDIPGAAA